MFNKGEKYSSNLYVNDLIEQFLFRHVEIKRKVLRKKAAIVIVEGNIACRSDLTYIVVVWIVGAVFYHGVLFLIPDGNNNFGIWIGTRQVAGFKNLNYHVEVRLSVHRGIQNRSNMHFSAAQHTGNCSAVPGSQQGYPSPFNTIGEHRHSIVTVVVGKIEVVRKATLSLLHTSEVGKVQLAAFK